MTRQLSAVAAGVLGAAAVALGAFGAHALRDSLSGGMLAIWHTAVQYHFYHAIALLAVSLAGREVWTSGLARWACGLWIAGITVFSGSLYALALTGIGALGAITPIGGVAFIAGWGLIAMAGWKALSSPAD